MRRKIKPLLYEVIAYCLYNGYPIHRAIALYGSGRNGKGQYMTLQGRFLGEDNTTSSDLDRIIESRFDASKLYGKLCAFIRETDYSVLKSTAAFKKLTGGDKLSCEFKNAKVNMQFIYIPGYKNSEAHDLATKALIWDMYEYDVYLLKNHVKRLIDRGLRVVPLSAFHRREWDCLSIGEALVMELVE